MKKVLERLMGTALDDDDDEEEEVPDNGSAQSVHCTLSRLCDWYNCRTKVGLRNSARVNEYEMRKYHDYLTRHHLKQKSSSGTPGKKRSADAIAERLQPPVVVIFKDLEAFNPKVLQDFILICRYFNRLKFKTHFF